jgi:acyl-CoA synthetase (NDP forming)
MHPQHIAVIGASNNMLNMGTRILSTLISLGFQGQVFPVHPKLDQVLGLKAYQNVNQIPLVADLAVIVVPTASVSQVLRECGQKGIRQAIIISGGFREAGQEGRRREDELITIAQQYGIRFLGPNCIGVVNPRHRFNTTVFHYEAAMEGFIGMVSQSGSFVTQMFYHLEKFGLGFSQAFSIGNQADIDLADCIEYLEGCERTRVIGLYIEAASISKASSRPRNLCGLLGRFPGASRSLRCMWAVPRQAGGPGVLIRGRWPDRIGFMTASFGSAGLCALLRSKSCLTSAGL